MVRASNSGEVGPWQRCIVQGWRCFASVDVWKQMVWDGLMGKTVFTAWMLPYDEWADNGKHYDDENS